MELLTDVLAIAGWAMLGFVLPTHIAVFRSGSNVFGDGYDGATLSYWIYSALSFGLIAASLVLG